MRKTNIFPAALLAVALMLTGCSLFSSNESTNADGSHPVGQNTSTARLEQNLPADTQLIHQKLTYLFNPSDKIYVVNLGDYTADGSRYENSGRYLQHQLQQSLEQHGSQTVKQEGYFDPDLMQQEAQYHGCNLIMTARIQHLYDNPMEAKELSVLVNTYSARSGDLLNSVLLNGRAESLNGLFALQGGTAQVLINNYINLLFQKTARSY